MTHVTALAQLSDEVLHGEVKRLAGRANTLLAELLAHLAEVEERGIHRERACTSLYAYCVYELRMSEDEAQRRCRAARLSRQFPVLLTMLAEASIHLTGIILIGPHLTRENHDELLGRVRFRTKREIERLVAEFAPAPDAPARIEPLHTALPHFEERTIEAGTPARTRNTWAAYVRALAGPIREMQAGIGAGQAPPAATRESSVDVSALPALDSSTGAHHPVQRATPATSPPGPRYRVQFTADQAFVDLLGEARDLLQHAVPNRDIVEVQRRALQSLVKQLRARKLAATDRPRAPTRPSSNAEAAQAAARTASYQPAPRQERVAPARRPSITAEVRRAVWQRDATQCAYVDARGQRCRERAGLELHHLDPHARGGPATADNLTLRCRAHNALAAERDFGRAWMFHKVSARRAGAAPPR